MLNKNHKMNSTNTLRKKVDNVIFYNSLYFNLTIITTCVYGLIKEKIDVYIGYVFTFTCFLGFVYDFLMANYDMNKILTLNLKIIFSIIIFLNCMFVNDNFKNINQYSIDISIFYIMSIIMPMFILCYIYYHKNQYLASEQDYTVSIVSDIENNIQQTDNQNSIVEPENIKPFN